MIRPASVGRREVDALLDAGVTFVTGVADSVFTGLIAALEESELGRRYLLATREDNAVALAAGAHLAGERPLVFMESSGIGNAVDALTSLACVSRIPMVLLVAWAGYQGRDVPHHNSIGEGLADLLRALRVPALEVGMGDGPDRLGAVVGEAMALAVRDETPVAVLGIPRDLARTDA